MSTSTCWSCRSLLRYRLRAHISFLEQSRRAASTNARPSLSWYNDTTAPTSTQLEAAEKFFLSHQPRKLWTATEWRKHNDGENTSLGLIPEVAFLGRSNVGKSSLLNALLISPALNHVGPRPGKTTTMHAWAVSPTDPKTGGAVKGSMGDMITKCAVLDMPGYGYASHDDWGQEIMSYLKNRKQLKRAFVIVDGRHGLKSGDVTMLKLLRKQGVSAQVVVSKCDKLDTTEGSQMVEKLWDDIQETVNGPGLGLLGEVLVVGSLGDGRKNDKIHYKGMRGVHEVQWAVLRATGLDEYAVTVASQGNARNIPSMPNSGKLGLSVSMPTESKNPTTQSRTSAPVQMQSQSPPQTPFSWPAKLRQPTSGIPATTPNSRSPPSRTMKPMNAPAPSPQLVSNFAGQDLMFMVPPQQATTIATSRGEEPRTETPHAGFGRPKQAGFSSRMPSIKPRHATDYSERDSPPAAERPAARTSTATPGAWTGSAVGGMADLEALSSRPVPGRRTPAQPASKSPSKRRPSRGNQPKDSTVVSSRDKLAKASMPKVAWTGPAVGGMADLEEMMARGSRPSGVAGTKPVQKTRRR